jgi:hypothetical protein
MFKLLLSGVVFFLFSFTGIYQKEWESKYIKLNQDGSLTYIPDEKGNVIPDFSRVGYHQGSSIPEVKVVKKLSPPKNGDSGKLIQDAIDEVAQMIPDRNGFRGAILLRKGTYEIDGSLRIAVGGIVLRGEGDTAEGTKIVATGTKKRALLSISGEGKLQEIEGSRVKITDRYIPVGAFSFHVENAAHLKPGDAIVMLRPGTENWISDLQMDKIAPRQGTLQWVPNNYNLHFERKIVEIEGNKVTVDNPAVIQFEEKYGAGEIYKYSFDGRIAEVGIENIYFESSYASDTDEEHSNTAISMNRAEHCWVSNVTARYFSFAAVSLGSQSKNITITDSKCFDAKSLITGSRRYSFDNNGQLNLFKNLETTEGRHDFVTGAKTLGPNVFYNCKATNTHADIGPHHRWAAGTLYDNIQTDGEINVQDRGNWGTGHGWAGVTQVLWNCKVKRAAVQNPWVSGYNYSIGTQGEKHQGRLAGRPDGLWENHEISSLTPASLYLAQLKDRLK